MKYIFINILCFSAYCSFTSAMHGGDYISIDNLPYMAQLSLRLKNTRTTYCGAAILSEYWLLSAAHCLGTTIPVVKWKIRIGSSTTLDKGILLDIDEFIVHGDHSLNNDIIDNDICLIKVKTPIAFDEFVQPIKVSRSPPQTDDIITVAGFGSDHFLLGGSVLKMGYMPVISNEECGKSYKITKNMFCVDVKLIDLCFGDSGSPSTLNGELVGTASQGCEYTKPNVFTNIAKYYDWIVNNTGIEYSD